MKKLLVLASGIAKCLENIFQFIAVVMLFYLLLYTLYMMFTLGNSSAFEFFAPFANIVISLAGAIWEPANTIVSQIWGFITGILLLTVLFLISQFLKQRFNILGKFFADMRLDYLKNEEHRINKELQRDIQKMNQKISACVIYIELKAKDYIHEKVDIDEQYKILNQFLYSRTGVIPKKNGYGYIFSFPNIEKIDNDLEYFFKAIHSQAPVDYLFILQVIENTFEEALFEITKLRNSGVHNKILMTPTTNLRYEHNVVKNYGTGVVGNYVFDGEMHSIYELRERFF